VLNLLFAAHYAVQGCMCNGAGIAFTLPHSHDSSCPCDCFTLDVLVQAVQHLPSSCLHGSLPVHLHIKLDQQTQGPLFFVFFGNEHILLEKSTCTASAWMAIQTKLHGSCDRQEDRLAEVFGLSNTGGMGMLMVRTSSMPGSSIPCES
jgi:hypothetical protein